MLQFLPALLLLMLNGASPIDRLALAERLPDALRILIEVKSPEDDETPLPSAESEAVDELDHLQLTAEQIEIAKVLAHLFESAMVVQKPSLSSPIDPAEADCIVLVPWDSPPISADQPYLESRRTRAGPIA